MFCGSESRVAFADFNSFFCFIVSGEVPQHPVVTKSGQLYERRLIEKYISENERDPLTGEALTVEDLIDIKGPLTTCDYFIYGRYIAQPTAVKPRTPSATSIPSLLVLLQNEWDAIMLETFSLKQQFEQTRQELSHALYQNEAACRVIARLMKERDAAREYVRDVKC